MRTRTGTDHVEGDGRASDRVTTVVLHRATNPDVLATYEARLLDGPVERYRALRTTHSQLTILAYLDLRLTTSSAECTMVSAVTFKQRDVTVLARRAV